MQLEKLQQKLEDLYNEHKEKHQYYNQLIEEVQQTETFLVKKQGEIQMLETLIKEEQESEE